ncbi:hypothetical protein [Edaphobacter sp. HDX4]
MASPSNPEASTVRCARQADIPVRRAHRDLFAATAVLYTVQP